MSKDRIKIFASIDQEKKIFVEGLWKRLLPSKDWVFSFISDLFCCKFALLVPKYEKRSVKLWKFSIRIQTNNYSIHKIYQSLSKNCQNDVVSIRKSWNRHDLCKRVEKKVSIFIKGSKENHDFHQRIARKAIFMSKDCEKTILPKDCGKKIQFLSKDCQKDAISVKESENTHNFRRRIAKMMWS